MNLPETHDHHEVPDVTEATVSPDTAASTATAATTDTVVLHPVTAAGTVAASSAPATLEARAVSAWFGSHQVLERVSSPCPPDRSPP